MHADFRGARKRTGETHEGVVKLKSQGPTPGQMLQNRAEERTLPRLRCLDSAHKHRSVSVDTPLERSSKPKNYALDREKCRAVE